ncbi:MAG: lysophospholipase [Cellvibrionaceae bacterium]
MLHSETQLIGPRSHKLYAQSWFPDSDEKLKGIIVVAHGLAEHSGRHMNLVNYFVPLNYRIVAIDHVGHGKSEGERCYIKSMDDFVEPLNRLVLDIKKQHPSLPIILLGHSMGGLIAIQYLSRYQTNVSAAILSSPAVYGVAKPSKFQQLIILLKSIISPKAGFVQLSSAGVSRDPKVVEAYDKDPLVYSGKMTYGLAINMAKAMGELNNIAPDISLPMLIVQAGKDQLINPNGAKDLFSWLGSQDKELTMYPNSYHEVLNEPEKDQLLEEIKLKIESWIALS